MLLSKDAIADVVEVLRPGDFYRPAHQAVYDSILDLYGRGEPADPITVSAELERRGELLRVGGAPYLHTLIATVPTAANAGYYAEIVAEKADAAPAGRGRHPDRPARLRGAEGAGRRRGRRPRAGRDLRRHRAPHHRGLLVAGGAAPADDGRDRGHRLPRRLVPRRAHRLRRPRRADQRPAPRPDDHRRGPARRRQGARARHAAADPDRLDDDGRGRRRRPAARRRRPADDASSPRPR